MRNNKIRRFLRFLLLILGSAFILIQFLPVRKNKTKETSSQDFIQLYSPPSNIQKILKDACYDCHSNNTHYPWYGSLQPVAFLMENHIFKGKKELNFSEFGKYSRRKQRNKIRRMIKQIQKDKMPLLSYRLLHGDANLSKSEKQKLIQWLESIIN